jgi:hypothetical protein
MRSFLITAALLLSSVSAWAQMPTPVTVSAVAKPAVVKPGGHGTLLITVKVADGYHINSAKPSDKMLIPTTFKGSTAAGIKFGAPQFGTARSLEIPAAKPISVYMGKTTIKVPFTVAKTAKAGAAKVGGKIGYQACNDTACFPPAHTPVSTSITVK